MAYYQSQLFHFHFTVEIGSLWTFSVSQYFSLVLSSALSQSREQPQPVCNRRPCLRVIDTGVGEVESNTGNHYSSQLWIAKLTVCAHRRESCCVVRARITWPVEAGELRSTCAPPPKATWRIDSTSSVNRSLLLQSFPWTSAEVQAYATRFGSPPVAVLFRHSHARCCTTTVAVALFFWLLPRVKFHPKERNATSYRRGKTHSRQCPSQEEGTSTNSKQQLSKQYKWTVALCVGTDLWPQKPKKVTKTQKKIYFRPDLQNRWTLQVRWPLDLEIPLDSNHDPSLQRRKAKRWPISPFLTPAARCGECRFNTNKTDCRQWVPCTLCQVDSSIVVVPWARCQQPSWTWPSPSTSFRDHGWFLNLNFFQ